MNDLELLRPSVAFAAVVEEGSFRAAAERLGLSAPYVSQLVSDLETRLGRQLLHRSTRKIALSNDGARFLQSAQAIASALNEGAQLFRDQRHGLVGRLTVSAPTVFATPVFATFLTTFQDSNPAIRLSVSLDDQVTDLLETQTDLVLRVGEPENDLRPAKRLFQTFGIVCASKRLAASIRTPKDLERFRWLMTPAMSKPIKLVNSDTGENVAVTPEQTMTSNNGQLIKYLVSQSSGWAVFPDFSVRNAIASGEVAQPLAHWRTPPVGVYALYSARRTALSNAKGFVESLQEYLAVNAVDQS